MKYRTLAELYERLEAGSKRLEKTHMIAMFLKGVPANDLKETILLLQGRVFPGLDERKAGVSSQLLIKAISKATGAGSREIEGLWKKTGDLGLAAQKLIMTKSQSTLFSRPLTVSKVRKNLQSLAGLEGTGSVPRKVGLVTELFSGAGPLEAKYIARTVLEELRIGVGEGTIREAIVLAHSKERLGISYDTKKNLLGVPEEKKEQYRALCRLAEEAYNMLSDYGEVAEILFLQGTGGLKRIAPRPLKPVRAMLFQKASGIKEAFKSVGRPAAFEYKYDGFRVQIHKADGRIRVFTRRLEDVTAQFPDIAEAAKGMVKGSSFILDGEAVGLDRNTGRYLPFQKVSQRIRRKHNIQAMVKSNPVEVNVFDVLYHDGKTLLQSPFRKRRELLQAIVSQKKGVISPSSYIETDDEEAAERFYKQALQLGNEGIMAKSLGAPYKPGSRVGFGVKIKPVMESLDLAVTGAEWGEGKRASWLTSFELSVRDSEGSLLKIGRVSTGLKELSGDETSFSQMTELLKPLITGQEGRKIRLRPETVIEVEYEEIQKSTSYSSGFALRFPRFKRLRSDRSVDDIDSLETVRRLYEGQRGQVKSS